MKQCSWDKNWIGLKEKIIVICEHKINFCITYCNWGTIPGSADAGVIGVIGPGVAGPIEGTFAWLGGPPIIGDIIFCWKQNTIYWTPILLKLECHREHLLISLNGQENNEMEVSESVMVCTNTIDHKKSKKNQETNYTDWNHSRPKQKLSLEGCQVLSWQSYTNCRQQRKMSYGGKFFV